MTQSMPKTPVTTNTGPNNSQTPMNSSYPFSNSSTPTATKQTISLSPQQVPFSLASSSTRTLITISSTYLHRYLLIFIQIGWVYSWIMGWRRRLYLVGLIRRDVWIRLRICWIVWSKSLSILMVGKRIVRKKSIWWWTWMKKVDKIC